MSLFTDLDFVTSADMLAIDPAVTADSRAGTPPIIVDTPLGIAAQCCDEVGQKLLNANQAYTGFMPPFAMPNNQTAAVLNLVGPSVNRSRISLSQVVVSSDNPTDFAISKPSALKRYAVYRALEMFYRTCYHRKQDDRFEKKMTLYAEEIRKKYWPRFFNQGVPIVFKPLATPGAVHEYNAGTWSLAAGSVTTVAGSNGGATAFQDVAITWVDQTKYVSPTNKGNAESAPSATLELQVVSGNVIQVSISNLNAPNGLSPINVGLGQGLIIPGSASGWNIYAGSQGGPLYLQNSTPIPILTTSYTFAGPPVLAGYVPDSGQYCEAKMTMQLMVMRG